MACNAIQILEYIYDAFAGEVWKLNVIKIQVFHAAYVLTGFLSSHNPASLLICPL